MHLYTSNYVIFYSIILIFLQLRSETIATYALCGFANVGAMGVQIGGISAICPSKRQTLAAIALRAMVAGTMACFMTACIAGEIRSLVSF